jgi:prophage tail gpP-like protein
MSVAQTFAPTIGGYPPSEICTLIVNGQRFTDWETVWIEHRWHDAYAFFRFTAAERDPMPQYWTRLQFKPGDSCTIELGGQTALTGMISDRETSYDAFNHSVQLIGKSNTFWGYKSSVDTKTGSFDGQSFEQVARAVLAPYPGAVKTIGTLNPLPFVKLQNEIGELTWAFLERIARPRGIVLGADALGNFLLIGQHTFPVSSELIEGFNIKNCKCLISHNYTFQEYDVVGQHSGDDQTYGSAANELKGTAPGTAPLASKLITPAEQPITKPEAFDRAHQEAKWNQGTIITAQVAVYGWLRGGAGLWKAGDVVHIKSPMAMLDMSLKIRTVTFEQNDRTGTQTTLELVAPWLLNDGGNMDPGNPSVPSEPPTSPQGSTPPGGGTVEIGTPVITGGE